MSDGVDLERWLASRVGLRGRRRRTAAAARVGSYFLGNILSKICAEWRPEFWPKIAWPKITCP